jgi:hypothetical protein
LFGLNSVKIIKLPLLCNEMFQHVALFNALVESVVYNSFLDLVVTCDCIMIKVLLT